MTLQCSSFCIIAVTENFVNINGKELHNIKISFRQNFIPIEKNFHIFPIPIRIQGKEEKIIVNCIKEAYIYGKYQRTGRKYDCSRIPLSRNIKESH